MNSKHLDRTYFSLAIRNTTWLSIICYMVLSITEHMFQSENRLVPNWKNKSISFQLIDKKTTGTPFTIFWFSLLVWIMLIFMVPLLITLVHDEPKIFWKCKISLMKKINKTGIYMWRLRKNVVPRWAITMSSSFCLRIIIHRKSIRDVLIKHQIAKIVTFK